MAFCFKAFGKYLPVASRNLKSCLSLNAISRVTNIAFKKNNKFDFIELKFSTENSPSYKTKAMFYKIGDTASWTCPSCTLLNKITNSTCEACDTIKEAESWRCGVCTFLNGNKKLDCHMCLSSRYPPITVPAVVSDDQSSDDCQIIESFPTVVNEKTGTGNNKAKRHIEEDEVTVSKRQNIKVEDVTVEVHPVAGPLVNNLLAGLHSERRSRAKKPTIEVKKEETEGTVKGRKLSILSYNLWFNEQLELEGRMAAIGRIIQQKSPDILCFQEVTPSIYKILQKSQWWDAYKCSVSEKEALDNPYFVMQMSKLAVKQWHKQPFSNSVMGRELSILGLADSSYKQLVVATSHLESPCPAPPSFNQMFSKERKEQLKESLGALQPMKNVVFLGDMNWNEKNDGSPPLGVDWMDAWMQTNPDKEGFTYDCKANKMLEGGRLKLRLDRAFCKLNDFQVCKMELVGTEAIPGLTYKKNRKVKGKSVELVLPVFPSDHFGLHLELNIK